MLRLEVEVVVDVGKPREIRAYSAHRKALRAARSTVFGCFCHCSEPHLQRRVAKMGQNEGRCFRAWKVMA